MLSNWLLPALLSVSLVYGQTTTITLASTTAVLTGDNVLPTNVTYLSYSSTIYLSSSSTTSISGLNLTNSTFTSSRRTTQATVTNIGATSASSSLSTSATRTSSSSRPTNTQPCNGYPEFCNRKYSNITMVAAHNFAFVRKNNVASNQMLGLTDQLEDGIRMLQAQAHYVNNTLFYCHTSCDLLNVGKVVDYFTQIREWVEKHPYDVVTILIGNSDFATVGVEAYVDPLVSSGLEHYAYRPSQIPMDLESWPTLGEMIIRQQRVVIFMDYGANQTAVPYVLDEFSQMWETPFSPTDPAFPCTQQRPPGISQQQAQQRLYMANHNLNTPVTFLGSDILVPNFANINITNGVSGNSSLGLAANSCTSDWGRAPNFLLVDFYNYGSSPGSVFKVAAQHNNVTYNKRCCGNGESSAATKALKIDSILMASVAVAIIIQGVLI